MDNQQLVELTAEIVSAHVSNNQVELAEVGNLVAQVHAALSGLGADGLGTRLDQARSSDLHGVRGEAEDAQAPPPNGPWDVA
jgi:predicted transcriptional regulator